MSFYLLVKLKFLIEIGFYISLPFSWITKSHIYFFFQYNYWKIILICGSFPHYEGNGKPSLKYLSHNHKLENSKIAFFLNVKTIDQFCYIKFQITSSHSLYLAKRGKKARGFWGLAPKLSFSWNWKQEIKARCHYKVVVENKINY